MMTILKTTGLSCLLLFGVAEYSFATDIDHVIVYKSKRQMLLMEKDKVIRSYRINLGGNPLGHKIKEGDKRTPEGNYILDYRNPNSHYHKSLHISYPNKADKARAQTLGVNPGGLVMIHGLPDKYNWAAFYFKNKDWTNGCIALNNTQMDEVWSLVKDGTPITINP